jgi:hypothetical protein
MSWTVGHTYISEIKDFNKKKLLIENIKEMKQNRIALKYFLNENLIKKIQGVIDMSNETLSGHYSINTFMKENSILDRYLEELLVRKNESK